MTRAKAKIKDAMRELKYPLGYINPGSGHLQATVCFKDADGKWQAGYKAAHRVIAEWIFRREIGADEVVHHIDHDKMNNHHSNLTIIPKSDHTRMTLSGSRKRKRKLETGVYT